MLNNQLKSLQEKTFIEKTVSQNEMARRSIDLAKKREDDFDQRLKDILNKNNNNS